MASASCVYLHSVVVIQWPTAGERGGGGGVEGGLGRMDTMCDVSIEIIVHVNIWSS